VIGPPTTPDCRTDVVNSRIGVGMPSRMPKDQGLRWYGVEVVDAPPDDIAPTYRSTLRKKIVTYRQVVAVR
jgi:hypothetical protein